MIRILHVVGQMGYGGAQALIMNLLRHMDRDQVQFDFIVHSQEAGCFDSEIKSLGGRVFVLPAPSFRNLLKYDRALTRVLQDYGPFAGIHSHVYQFSGYILKVARRNNIPLRLVHTHTTSDGKPDTGFRHVYRWYMRRLVHRYATHFLGCSRPACESLFGPNCLQDPRTHVVRNAIDWTHYANYSDSRQTAGARLSIPPSGIWIGHVAGFRPVKNHAFLLEIFSAFLTHIPDAHLILVGDGPLRNKIGNLVRTQGLGDRVHLLGTRSDVPEILSALDLFIFPSFYEGIPLAVIEAQAAGVSCVVSTAVSSDVDIRLGLVQFASLDDDVDTWVNKAIQGLDITRPEWPRRLAALQTTGYDIQQVSLQLHEIYTKSY